MNARTANIQRQTGETEVELTLNLDGERTIEVSTGVGFFDHMLHLLAFHAGWDLKVQAAGDLQVDAHHTVEDVGIVLGRAFADAVGDRTGIARYGCAYIPLNESLGRVVTDVCGRPHIEYFADYPTAVCGEFPLELVEEFMRSFVLQSGTTAHIDLLRCRNSHHGAEVLFKGLGKALAESVARVDNIALSTKGKL